MRGGTAGAAALVMTMTATMPVEAHGHRGFHGHAGFGFHHGRPHCRTVRDQDGFRRRVCV